MVIDTALCGQEADALCDRIGIMAGGGLRCLGTQTHLKNKYGEGFKVQVTADTDNRDAQISALILSLSPDAKLAFKTGRQFTYTVPLTGGDVAHIFNTMETKK